MPKTKQEREPYLNEILEKYYKNPDDPEIQKYKADIKRIEKFVLDYQELAERLVKEFTPRIQYFNTKILPEINRMVQTYSSFSQRLEEMIIRVNSLSEPLKVLIESISRIRTPLLYSQVAILQRHRVINIFQQPTIHIKSSFDAKEELKREEVILDSNITQLEKIKTQVSTNPFNYYPDTDTLIIIHTEVIGLNFSSPSGRDNMSILAKIFLTALQTKGNIRDGFIEVGLTNSQITEELKKFGVSIVGDLNRWISNTKNNILKKIPKVAKSLVSISDYNRILGGYYFRIKLNPKLPLL